MRESILLGAVFFALTLVTACNGKPQSHWSIAQLECSFIDEVSGGGFGSVFPGSSGTLMKPKLDSQTILQVVATFSTDLEEPPWIYLRDVFLDASTMGTQAGDTIQPVAFGSAADGICSYIILDDFMVMVFSQAGFAVKKEGITMYEVGHEKEDGPLRIRFAGTSSRFCFAFVVPKNRDSHVFHFADAVAPIRISSR